MQVVLLAAGMGLRLGPLTRTTPKAMVELNGRPLIDYSLPFLLANKRVSEVLVVGGFGFDTLERHISENYAAFGDRVQLVQNTDFTRGNLYTLGKAIPYLESSFLICNVDHVYSEETWRFILQEREQVSIFCDFLREFQEDEMKVLLDENRKLSDMSKTITEYDGAYVGLTYIPSLELNAYIKAFERAGVQIGEKAVVENVLPLLADHGHEIQVVPFDKYTWYEVDTREDLRKAELALDSLVDSVSMETTWR